MKIGIFDIEIYQLKNSNEIKSKIFYKFNNQHYVFTEINEFTEKVLTHAENNIDEYLLVGFNTIFYDFIMLSVWKDLSDLNKLKFYSDLLIDTTRGHIISSIYHFIKLLEEVDTPESKFIKQCVNKYHPSIKNSRLFYQCAEGEETLVKTFDLRNIPIYKNGSLKLNSLQNGDSFYLNIEIPEFNAIENEKDLNKYAMLDIDATESLAKSSFKYIEATYDMLKEFNIVSTSNISVVNASKYIGKEIDITNNLIKPSFNNEYPKDFLDYEKKIYDYINVSVDAEKIDFVKTFNNKKQFVFSLNLLNKKGNKNRGGLHGAKNNSIIVENVNEEVYVCECDFSLLYSNIMISDICPILSKEGKEIVKYRIEKRNQMKKEKNPKEVCYKLLNNGTYGLLPYLYNYHQNSSNYGFVGDYITSTAQVYMIKFLQFITDSFKNLIIINVNTDGVFFSCKGHSKEFINAKIDEFNNSNNIIKSKICLNFYKKIIVFNTNCYLKQSHDDEFSMKGNALFSTKSSKIVKKDKEKATLTHYPLFVNVGEILKHLILEADKENLNLLSSDFLNNINSLVKKVLDKNILPVIFYRNGLVGETKLRGKLINDSDITSGTLSSKNFDITESDTYENNEIFLTEFFNSFLLPFYTYDMISIKNSILQSNIFSKYTMGRDITRQNFMCKITDDSQYLFCNSLISLTFDNLIQKEIKLINKKSKDIKSSNPLESLKNLLSYPDNFLTKTMCESDNIIFKNYKINIYDFDFKKEIDREERVKFIKDLHIFIEENKENIIYAEYNKDFDIIRGKNGVHLFVVNRFTKKKIFKEFLEKYQYFYDNRKENANIMMYKNNKNLIQIGNVNDLSEYYIFMMNNFYGEISNTKNKKINNISLNRHIDRKELKVDDIINKYKDDSLMSFLLTSNNFTFNSKRSDWIKQLSILRNNVYVIFEKFNLSNNVEKVKDYLIFQSLSCKKTAPKTQDAILDTVTTIEYLCKNDIFNKSFLKDNYLYEFYRKTAIKMFDCYNSEVLTKIKQLPIELCKEIFNLVSYSYETKDKLTKIKEINFNNNEKFNFTYASTGSGKTYSIMKNISQDDSDNIFIFGLNTLQEISVLKKEFETLYPKIAVCEITADSINKLYEDDKFLINKVYLISSAYLAKDNLPFLIKKLLEEKQYILIIDEFDKYTEYLKNTKIIAKPVKSIKNKLSKTQFTTDLNNLLNKFNITEYKNDKLYKNLIHNYEYENIEFVNYYGYKNKNNRGSCSDGCILNFENTSFLTNNIYNKSYGVNTTIDKTSNSITNIFKLKCNFLQKEYDWYVHDSSLEIKHNIFDNMIISDKGFNLTMDNNKYYSCFIRCDAVNEYSYLFNSNNPCGTILESYINYYTIDKIFTKAQKVFLFSASFNFTSVVLFNKYDFKLCEFVSKENLIKDVKINIIFNKSFNKKDLKSFNNENCYRISNAVFLNKSNKILNNIDSDNKKSELYDVPNKFKNNKEDIVLKVGNENQKDNTKVLNNENEMINLYSFSKSTYGRSMTLPAKSISIEIGNTSVLEDVFFYEYLMFYKFELDNFSDIIENYIMFNSENAKNSAIQNSGRVLRKYIEGEEINDSGREINFYIKENYTYLLFDILKNVIKRCDKNTLSIYKNGDECLDYLKEYLE